MIQFNWPWVFLLTPLPWLIHHYYSRQTLTAIRIPPVLEQSLQTLVSKTPVKLSIRPILMWLCWLSLLTSVAQPWRQGDAIVQPASGRAMALAVDVSGSMKRQDYSLDGVTQDRLSVVKKVAHDFIVQRQGDRVSLVLYGKQAFIASPLTFDLHALSSILNSAGIGMAGQSTAIGDAIGLAIQTLQGDPATQKAIVLLSDGTNNAGSVEPESAALLAHSLGIRVHTIALGSVDGERGGYRIAQSADLDQDTLKAIAEQAGGQFFRATNTADLQQIYTAIDALERADVAAPPVIIRHDLRQWPQALLMLCVLSIAYVQRIYT